MIYTLEVRRSGPFVPESFHGSYDEAFDAGLMAVTGQSMFAIEPFPAHDFRIRATVRGAEWASAEAEVA